MLGCIVNFLEHGIIRNACLSGMGTSEQIVQTHQVCECVHRMMHMWKEISNCHQSQMKAVEAMRRLDNSTACEATTSSHRDSTAQLEVALIGSVITISFFQLWS